MSPIVRRVLSLLALSVSLFSASSTLTAAAQSPVTLVAKPQADRVLTQPSLNATTRLRGHLPGWAVASVDDGPVAAETSLRLTFVLSRAADRQADFEQMLADQQNPSSARYHQWLTPSQVGSLYGPTQHDLDALTQWLTAQGLTVTDVSPSAIFVSAQAPAAVIAKTFAVSFDLFSVNEPNGVAQTRIAATADPAIPSALAGIINSISGLSEMPLYPMQQSRTVTVPGKGDSQSQYSPASTDASPLGTSSGGVHYLSPNDFNLIYDVKAAASAGFTGATQKVAIVGRSRVLADDITNFEAITALASSQPNTIIPPTPGVDPGLTANSIQGEATLDVQRVIGTAPGAQVDLVVSKSSATQDGIAIAAQYEVAALLDPIMNISFGSCETNNGIAGVTFWDSLFATAAAEGISTFVSSGDSGAASCQTSGSAPSGVQARSVNVICASSYVTCVGGTEFADFASPSTYWSATNGTGLQSALSYIPEGAWNEPTSTSSTGVTSYVVLGTGGGVSAFVSKPIWQVGTGVPADGFRDLPDVSFSSSGHNGYISCVTYTQPVTQCVPNPTTGAFGASLFSGTSAAAPSMAGIAALLNQKLGGKQGNINPLLYRLASTSTSAFHDATPTTSGVGTCDINTPSMCNNSTPSATALTGGLAGFPLTIGYDQTTGLGSLDAANFLNAAAGTPLVDTLTTLTLTPSTVALNGAVSFTATVAATRTTAATPTGNVQFYLGSTAFGPLVALVGGKASLATTAASINAGTFAITAQYVGDTNFLASTSVPVPLTVTGPTPSVSLTAASSTLTLAAGATSGNTDLLTVTSSNFVGPVSLSCSVTFSGTATSTLLPTCSVAPSPVTLTSNGSATSTLTISSTAPRLAGQLASANIKPQTKGQTGSVVGLAFASLFLLAFLPLRRRPLSFRSWQTLPTTLLLLCGFATLTACSGSSTPSSPNPLLVSSTTTTLVPSSTSIPAGSTDTFTATVVNSGFNTTVSPTGNVQFFQNGTTSLGTAALVNGTATSATITFATANTYPISASYSGDTNFSASASAGVPITVTPTGTTTGSYTITVTAAGTGASRTLPIALIIQ